MKLAVDSSVFAKRYIREPGSDLLDDFLQNASQLGLCIILVPEIVSALNRRVREGFLTEEAYRKARKQLLADVHDASVLQITPSVVAQSIRLLENNTLRSMDVLYVACALEWRADLFITSDKRQLKAAADSGLKSEFISPI
ncbi:MAG: type II toxin-antitoxin system VapC family toxin [Candidatus Sabulitectum sp.]|nr:type II toxin-antitoxin system VapC family toxin [Candidatus Sabulitectum sp.]